MDSYYNSLSNLVLNANKNEEPNSGLFDFNNEFGSPDQFLTPFSTMNQFLDSPSFIFNSNIISSPTTGNYSGYDFEEGKTNVSDLVSRSRTSPIANSRNKMEESMKSEVLDWNEKSQSKQIDFSMEINKIEPKLVQSSHEDCKIDPIQASNKQSKFEDGYNWRKYGQKQVKGSQKPRSYFKCSYPDCPTKKKVEKDLNGYITEIIYKGKHNHPVPQNMKKSSLNSLQNAIFDYSSDKNRFESFSRNSTASFGEAEHDQDSSFSESSNDRENEPNAKRWKIDEAEGEGMSYVGSKTVQEPRVVIETKSEIDILDDGYKWRKYGQKVVKGNPNPRNYYKCTNIACPVRKLVERAAHDLRSVITTYEGKHNHNVPSRDGSSYSYARNELTKSNTTKTSNNYMSETSMPLANYSYNVRGMRGLTIDNGQTHIGQHLEKSNDFGLMGSTYTNQDWVTQKFLSKTKEEPENDFIYHSF